MSLRFASTVSKKKSSVKSLVLNSKSFAYSRTLSSKSLRVKSNILSISLDRWFLDFDQRATRQKIDDESQIMRKIRRNFNFFSLTMTFFFSFKARRYARQTFFVCVAVHSRCLRLIVVTTFAHRLFQKNFVSSEDLFHDIVSFIAFFMLCLIWIAYSRRARDK
jgi:hypothetical protein